MTDETPPPARTEVKKMADVLLFPPPYRFTPEIVARILLSDSDSISRVVMFVEYKNGRRMLTGSAGMTGPFYAEAGALLLARANAVSNQPPPTKKV